MHASRLRTKLGMRLGALDAEREARRKRRAEEMAANAEEEIDPDDLPWPDPVTDIGEVLDAAVKEIARYLVADATTYDTAALWSCGAHLLPRADLDIDIAPRLAFQARRSAAARAPGSN